MPGSNHGLNDSGENHRLENDNEVFENLFSVTELRRTWSLLRKELRLISTRDVIDWTDWAITIEASLPKICEEIVRAEYSPSKATRIEDGKTKGAFRVFTSLNVKDALIYRHICDFALKLALPRKVAGAYFSRRHTPTPIGRTFEPSPDPSDRFYAIWLRYNEYRTRTFLNEPYEILVITDISNYFDSIQHELLFEYLAPLGLSRKTVGLLGRLLETFRPESGHSPSPRVGIPIDELDCSRELAHIFLFEHDRRIVDKFGENNYVRWMDDQNVGVQNKTEARRVINEISRSLAEQRLTLNSGKTAFLSPNEIVDHFHLDANDELNEWRAQLKQQRWRMSIELRQRLLDLWQRYSQGASAGKGNWDKILKRFYAYAARADMNFLEGEALLHLIQYPFLAERIFSYFGLRNRGELLIQLFNSYASDRENLFETVEIKYFEALLLLDASPEIAQRCRILSKAFASGQCDGQTRRPTGRGIAIICLYWFGESAEGIKSLYSPQDAISLPKEVARSWLTCITAKEPTNLEHILGILFGHASDDVLRLGRFFQELLAGRIETFGNYKNQKERYPLAGKCYDARAWMLLELASHGTNPTLNRTTRSDFSSFNSLIFTSQERAIAERVRLRLRI